MLKIMRKKCDRCQKYAPVVRKSPKILMSINSPISFETCGKDILGLIPMASDSLEVPDCSDKLLHEVD